jgi:hypothetical protein
MNYVWTGLGLSIDDLSISIPISIKYYLFLFCLLFFADVVSEEGVRVV